MHAASLAAPTHWASILIVVVVITTATLAVFIIG
jgi:hypothetical protein